MFQVSRTVVRRALDELEYEAVLERIRGKGTFVTKPKISEGLVQKLTGFYQDMVDKGLNPFTQILRRDVIPANARIAHLLDIKTGTQVLEIERLRFVEDEPLLLGLTVVQYDICPALMEVDLSTQSLYAVLEKECGLVIANARRTIEAVAATEREAGLLDVKEGAPLLMLRSLGFSKDGRPVEYFRGLHRGDRSCFEIELFRE
jgi:GntR family transcriptional regulator